MPGWDGPEKLIVMRGFSGIENPTRPAFVHDPLRPAFAGQQVALDQRVTNIYFLTFDMTLVSFAMWLRDGSFSHRTAALDPVSPL